MALSLSTLALSNGTTFATATFAELVAVVYGVATMKSVTLMAVAVLLSASCALAQQTQNPTPNTMTSGRPSAVLDDATCQTIWKMASPNGATISRDQAVPYIVNFQMVDVNGDGQITADEFKAACGKGMVKNTKP